MFHSALGNSIPFFFVVFQKLGGGHEMVAGGDGFLPFAQNGLKQGKS